IPRWISPAADGTLVMTVGSLLPVAPSAAWLQHLRPASDDPRHKPSGYLADRTGVGRFMLTYLNGALCYACRKSFLSRCHAGESTGRPAAPPRPASSSR